MHHDMLEFEAMPEKFIFLFSAGAHIHNFNNSIRRSITVTQSVISFRHGH